MALVTVNTAHTEFNDCSADESQKVHHIVARVAARIGCAEYEIEIGHIMAQLAIEAVAGEYGMTAGDDTVTVDDLTSFVYVQTQD
jgi:hypothetical protein